MKKTTFIFDFDGTLADSLQMGVDIYNKQIAPKFRCKKIEEKNMEILKGTNFHKLLKEHNISFFKLPILLFHLKRKMAKRMDEIQLIDDIKLSLDKLHKMGYKMGVLTSNNKKNVKSFLKHYEIDYLFEFVYAEKNPLGKDRAIKKIMKSEKLNDIIYVGDESRDIDACKKAGVDIVSVGWGFNTISHLREYNPNYLIKAPSELIEIAKTLV
ncbi:HAD-IA family hydrolase [Fusobacteria bacterium ZRK30]|nr:HAD-IA family hydrolase [Fusobacteria bacterium ZRK30]